MKLDPPRQPLPWNEIYKTWADACTELDVRPEILFPFMEIEVEHTIYGLERNKFDWVKKRGEPTSYVYFYVGHPRYGILDTAGALYDSRCSTEEQASIWMRAFIRDRKYNCPIVWEQREIRQLLNNLESSVEKAFPDPKFIWESSTKNVLPIKLDVYEKIHVPNDEYDVINRAAQEALVTHSKCQLIKCIDPTEKRKIAADVRRAEKHKSNAVSIKKGEVVDMQTYRNGNMPSE